MGNTIGSFISGIFNAIGNLFGSPIDFISGKSCSSICGPTWDFICYIENFCVANLMKLAMVFFLTYIVLLFIYLLYKIGIIHCISHSLFKMIWACFASCFYSIECCCSFLWFKILLVKRVNRRRRKIRDMEKLDLSRGDDYDESISYPNHRYLNRLASSTSSRWRDYRKDRFRNSLRPRRSHRVRLGIDRDLGNYSYRIRHPSRRGNNHDIKMTRISKFAHGGSLRRRNGYRRHQY